jgi:hypothetical protein
MNIGDFRLKKKLKITFFFQRAKNQPKTFSMWHKKNSPKSLTTKLNTVA